MTDFFPVPRLPGVSTTVIMYTCGHLVRYCYGHGEAFVMEAVGVYRERLEARTLFTCWSCVRKGGPDGPLVRVERIDQL